MISFVQKRALSRRAFLRGTGCAIALPWLDAMLPAFGRSAPEAVHRALFVFAPNGKKMDDWIPAAEGAGWEPPHSLEPLARHRERLLVLSGLALDGGRAHGDGPGDHARAAASYLTSAHPKKTGGADIRCGVSVDQVIAGAVGAATRFPSLELGLEKGKGAGSCDSGYSCAYTVHVSWRTPAVPVAKETRPRAVFERLIGPAGRDPVAAARERRRLRSVLDAVAEDARALERDLGAVDRAQLAEYLDAVRAVEKRIAAAEDEAPLEPPAGLAGGAPDGYPERVALMYELVVLAFRADLTRVATLMLGNAGSNRSYPFVEVPEGHHDLSHHGKDPHKLAQIRRIDRWHSERFADFLDGLAAVREDDQDLLDRSLVLFGSGLADGNAHAHHDLPIVLAGGLAPGGEHRRYPKNTPLANLYLWMLDRLGVEAEGFGDATGRLL
jgi:hypothetical protein